MWNFQSGKSGNKQAVYDCIDVRKGFFLFCFVWGYTVQQVEEGMTKTVEVIGYIEPEIKK